MSKLGLSITPGSRNGFGPFCTSKPAVVVAVDEGGALGEAWANSGGYTFTVFRDTTVYLEAPQEWNQTSDMIALARLYYPRLKAKWLLNPAEFYAVTNEIGGGEGQGVEANYRKLVTYEREVMRLANLDGFKVCVLNCAGGSPGDINIWRNVCLPFILEAGLAGNVYGRHVYGQGDLVGSDGKVIIGNPSRPLEESDILTTAGYRSGIILTECGIDGGYGYAGDRFIAQMKLYEQAIRSKANIMAMACWTAGDWNNANCQNALPALALYNLANPTPKWTPTIPTPPAGYKSVVFKIAQEHTIDEWAGIARLAHTEFKRTMTASGDNCVVMVGDGNAESYAVIFDPDLPSQVATIQQLQEARIAYQTRYYRTAPPAAFRLSSPVQGIPLVVTDPFNAPRNYQPPYHEGLDLRATNSNGQPVKILAGASGVIDGIRRVDPGTGYGLYVRVKSVVSGVTYLIWYCHLSAIPTVLAVGQSVVGGQELGTAGSTGNSTGIHLHLTVQKQPGGLSGYIVPDVIDPAPLLGLPASTLPGPGSTPPPATIDLRRFIVADPACWRVVRMPDGRQEDIQDMQLSGGMFVRRKNSLGEWWKFDGQFYYLVHDTSPDKDSQGNERVYTLTKNGVPGAPMIPLALAVNQSWQESGTHHVQFKAKNDCRLLSENSGAAQNSVTLVRYEKIFAFNRYGQNLIFDEVIWLKHKTETQIYGRRDGKSCGWLGWSAPWGESEPVEIYWNRPPMITEPNRYCSW